MSNEHLNLGALAPHELAVHVGAAMAEMAASGAELGPLQAVIYEAAKRYAEQVHTGARHRLVVISPDKDTDYCYVDMSKEEALARFTNSDDGALYNPSNLKVAESEFAGGFMLWRNMGSNMADMLGQRGMPPELADLLRPKG